MSLGAALDIMVAALAVVEKSFDSLPTNSSYLAQLFGERCELQDMRHSLLVTGRVPETQAFRMRVVSGVLCDFIEMVVVARDLVAMAASDRAFRLEPRQSALVWYCDLDHGIRTGDADPASYVRWVCPTLRLVHKNSTIGPQLDVRQAGPRSDLGRLAARIGRLAGRSPAGGIEGRFAYTDPHGVIDAELRQRIEHWPTAPHGDFAVRPAQLQSIRITGEGLIVESASWWDSTEALDHQIALAIDIARRLTELQRFTR